MTLAPTQAPTQGAPSRVRRWILPALALALVVACAAGIAIGAYGVGLGDVWDGIAGRLTGRSGDVADAVVVDIRAPRVVLAAIIGACLAAAGVLMQGVFANPLAEPGLVGVSSGAAVGAVLSIALGLTALGTWVLPAAALLGGMGVTAAVYLMARVDGRTEVLTLILTGVAINAFAGAVIGLLMSMSDDAKLRSITF